MRPKVAPIWSAMPAAAGGAIASSAARAATAALENNGRMMHTEDGAQGVADLAEGDPRPHGVEDERHQVVPGARGSVDDLEGPRGAACVAGGAQTPDTLGHGLADRGVDLEEMAGGRLFQDEVIDAHHDARLGLDLLLVAIGRFLDLALHEGDGADGAAEPVDLGDVGLRFLLEAPRESLHGEGAARNFATSSRGWLWALNKKEGWGANSSTRSPAACAAVT